MPNPGLAKLGGWPVPMERIHQKAEVPSLWKKLHALVPCQYIRPTAGRLVSPDSYQRHPLSQVHQLPLPRLLSGPDVCTAARALRLEVASRMLQVYLQETKKS